jgi:hypothetical protein
MQRPVANLARELLGIEMAQLPMYGFLFERTAGFPLQESGSIVQLT